jgi:hypothetical protein
MLKRFIVGCSLIGFGIILALMVLDIGIRIVNHWYPYFYCYDQFRGWGLNPGAHGTYTREGHSFFRINHDGFRGPDYVRPKPSGVIRVAVLGDSYVEAMQVEEDQTFTSVIGRELARDPLLRGRHIEALNFGVDGYGTAQELITLKRKVWSYQPNIVVLAIFLGNDIRNNSVVLEGDRCRPFYKSDGPMLTLTGPFIESPSFRLWCEARFDYRDLRLLELFRNTLEVATTRGGAPTPEHPVERAINYSIYKAPTDRAWQDAWDITEQLILATRDEVRRHGAMFLAVTEDTGIQVWPDPRVRVKFEKRLGVENLFYPDQRIAALGGRENFQVLTLAQPMQAYAEAHQVMLHGFSNTPKGFGHWNAIGHKQAGKLITAKLSEMISTGQCATCAVDLGTARSTASYNSMTRDAIMSAPK